MAFGRCYNARDATLVSSLFGNFVAYPDQPQGVWSLAKSGFVLDGEQHRFNPELGVSLW